MGNLWPGRYRPPLRPAPLQPGIGGLGQEGQHCLALWWLSSWAKLQPSGCFLYRQSLDPGICLDIITHPEGLKHRTGLQQAWLRRRG